MFLLQYIDEGAIIKDDFYCLERKDDLTTKQLSELVELQGKSIYGFCYNLTKDRSEADDLYQEAFLLATQRCNTINADKNPKAFLLAIAVRIWKNRRRKIAWRQRIAPTEALHDGVVAESTIMDNVVSMPEMIVISKELEKVLQHAAETLDDRFKIPLYMYYTAEMSIEEIAVALKIPKGTVKSRLYKARIKMKRELEASNYER